MRLKKTSAEPLENIKEADAATPRVTQLIKNELRSNQNASEDLEWLKNGDCCPEILVVDDIDYNRFVLKHLLQQTLGLKCCEAENGQEGIRVFEEMEKKRGKCCKGLRIVLMDI